MAGMEELGRRGSIPERLRPRTSTASSSRRSRVACPGRDLVLSPLDYACGYSRPTNASFLSGDIYGRFALGNLSLPKGNLYGQGQHQDPCATRRRGIGQGAADTAHGSAVDAI